MGRRDAALLLALLALAACNRSSVPPQEVEITYLQPVARSTPPVLRGRVWNRTGAAIAELEIHVFYGVGRETELDSLVLQDLKPQQYREFDFPLRKIDRQPTTWRAEPVRVEWAR